MLSGLQKHLGMVRLSKSQWEWSYSVGLVRVSAGMWEWPEFLRVCVGSSGTGQRFCRGMGLAGLWAVVHGSSQSHRFFFFIGSVIM